PAGVPPTDGTATSADSRSTLQRSSTPASTCSPAAGSGGTRRGWHGRAGPRTACGYRAPVPQPPPPPGWYPDPAGPPATRWRAGQDWTEHVQQAAPSAPPPPQPAPMAPPPVPQGAAPSLYEQSVLLVNQKTKLIELTNEYAVLDGEGNQIGAVVQVGQSAVK